MFNVMNLPKVYVEQLANKNQFVIVYEDQSKDERYHCFQSYKSMIAVYDKITGELYINWDMWDYSKTTLKHLKMFINEWTHYHYENKAQFLDLIANDEEHIIVFNEI